MPNLTSGDNVEETFENITDGETVVLPEGGEFVIENTTTVEADNWEIDGNGATIHVEGEVILNLRGQSWEFHHVNIHPRNDADPQNWLSIETRGSGWHVHHVAWTSENRTYWGQGGEESRMAHFVPGTERGGTGEITDCWLGHGWRGDNGFFAIAPFNIGDGDLWVRRCYIKGGGSYFPPNADKGPDDPDTSIKAHGTLNAEDCYTEAAYQHCWRTGGHHEKSVLRNCVMNQSEAVKEEVPWSRGDTREEGQWAARGVFNYAGPVEVVDCEIDATADQTDRVATSWDWGIDLPASVTIDGGNIRGNVDGNVTVKDNVGSNPDLTPPKNCVTSPEEAYKPTDTSPSYDHTLKVVGRGEPCNYRFSVSGELSADSDTLEPWDEISNGTADGWVTTIEQSDTYRFNGRITEFEFPMGVAHITLDGEPVSPDDLVADNTLKVTGKGEACNYRFRVSDFILARSDTLEEWDTVNDDVADGWVTTTNQTDVFDYNGEMLEFEFRGGSATLELNGSEVSVDELLGVHTLELRSETGGSYELSVSDSFGKASFTDYSTAERVDARTVSAKIPDGGGTDVVEYRGSIEALSTSGDIEAIRDGEPYSQ